MIKIKSLGEKLIIISALLFCISIPTSIFLDNVAAGLGLLGLLFLLISREKDWPSIKPFFLLLIPETLSIIINRYLSKFDINIKLTPYFVIYKSFKNKKIFKIGVTLLSISTIILCFSILFEAFTWINIKTYFLYLFKTYKLLNIKMHSSTIRPHGLFSHPLTAGGVLYILFCFYFILLTTKRKKRVMLLLSIILISLILNGSRSYLLALITFLIFTIIISLKFRQKLKEKLFIFISIFLFIFVVFFNLKDNPFIKQRFKEMINKNANWIRLTLWEANLESFKYNFTTTEKLVGNSKNIDTLIYKNMPTAYNKLFHKKFYMNEKDRIFFSKISHNIYLYYLTHYGILGLFGYLLFWFYFIFINIKSFKNLNNQIYLYFIASYLGFLVAGFFENNFLDAEVTFSIMFLLGFNYLLIKHPKILEDSNEPSSLKS